MKLFLLFFSLVFINVINAQDFDPKWLNTTPARNIGPGGMSGRTTAIDVVHDNPKVIFIGTASGGIWRSRSGGVSWKPIFNDQITASIGSIAIQQSSPDVIWAGTGEGNPRNSLNGGFGIFKSLDGGESWKNMGLEYTRHIHRIIIHPDNPNIVYVAAIGSPWGNHKERGVYKTINGGKSWRKILSGNLNTGAADLIMDPKNPNKLVAALWEHKREPWFFKSGGEKSGLFITIDGGENWNKKTEENGLPKGNLGRIGLAFATNKNNIIYALIEAKKNGLYKSVDGGKKWKLINNKPGIGNRPFYYSDIFVDPENENRVYSVFTYVNVSEDGGKSFSELMPAYGVSNGVHPDHHAWWIHPKDGDFIIDGNDGGMNISRDGGKTWRFIGNIPVAQFYHISTDNEFPYNVYGGMQDNGSWRGPAYVWKTQGIRNSYWQEIAFGDGFDVVPDRDNSRYGYAMSQQGNVSRYDWKTGNNYTVRPTHPNPDIKLRFNWNAAIGQDPFDNSIVYFGSQFVHKSLDKGLTWEIISPDLTTNDPNKQKQSESGGLTLDATGAENHCTLIVIEPSPIEKNMLWVASDDGKVHITIDGGKQWTDVTKGLKDLPEGSWIPQIKASSKNKGEALLIANDYRRFNYEAYAYRTKNYGKTWKRIVDSDDVSTYTLSIVEDIINPKLIFLGSDDGLYFSLNSGDTWQKFDSKTFPTVPTKDLAIHPREHDLVIGTFGRAAWILDDIRPLREIANNTSITNKLFKLFEPPVAYTASIQQPTGSRFGGDALFNGTNRDFGAQIKYFFNPTYSKIKDLKKDSIYLKVYDNNKLIRTLKVKSPDKKGFYKINWNMDEKGPKFPRRKIRKNDTEGSGVKVKPGKYKLIMEVGEIKDETSIIVKSDPRLSVSKTAIEDSYNFGKKLEDYIEIINQASDQLAKSIIIAKDFEKVMIKDSSTYKTQINLSKKMIKKMTQIQDLFFGKDDKRQGIIRSPKETVLSRIRKAYYYSISRPNGITKTENILINQAKNQLEFALDSVNLFFNKDWENYQLKMEELNLSPFKSIKKFNLYN
ncbi:MAG: hypothetical protein P8L83_07470 [Flavobacteriaceae bacterium]|nr:hypothetical protein [Flavobacteriaceae bacterium]